MVMIIMTTKKMIFIVEKGEEEENVVRTVLTNSINVGASKIILHIATVSYLFC